MGKVSNLGRLKKNYSNFEEKYNLPSFDEMNKDFRIEKISETETDFFIREIRTALVESFEGFLRFVEVLINPMNAPMFMFPIVKSLSSEDKQKLAEVHKKLAKIEFGSIKLIDYSEKKEVQFVKEAFLVWQEIKKDFLPIIEKIEINWDEKIEGKSKGYFG